MSLASFCAPTLRWSLALTLLAVLSVDAQAQRLSAAPAEIVPPDTHFHTANGQQPGARCAVPTPSERQTAALHAELEAFLARNGGTYAAGGTVTIPIAWHVVRQGTGSGNGDIPDSWIAAQIDVLNDSFDGTQGGYNTNFRFVLDRTDRTTNAAWYTGCYGSQELPMKQALHYSPATHFNIYSCRPSSGILGYATFPWSYPESDYRHGIVILDQSLPGGNAFPYNLGGTATHEGGHYLGLYHTFQGSCGGGDTPPGCTTGGDQVCDTAAEASPAFGCPNGRNTCSTGGPDPIHNYMDYTDDACYEEFTEGQSARMDQQVALYKPTLLQGSSAPVTATITNTGQGTFGGGGGTLTFRVDIENTSSSSQNIDAWLIVTLPNGSPYGPILGTPVNFNVGPGVTITQTASVTVPASAPVGTYAMNLNVGTYPGTIDDSDSFAFTKTAAPLTGGDPTEAAAWTGTFEEAANAVTASATEQTAAARIIGTYPNPFAGTSTIAFELDARTEVSLVVFNSLGQRVAVLAEGTLEAGRHVASFDGSALPSGVYLYRLQGGPEVVTGRLMLVR